jgi:Transposase IS116/IS110/IS902 family
MCRENRACPASPNSATSQRVAVLLGLSSRHYQSSSIECRSRLAKTGNAHLRRLLYFAAITPIRHNPPIREFAERLRACGKTKMTVVAAATAQRATSAPRTAPGRSRRPRPRATTRPTGVVVQPARREVSRTRNAIQAAMGKMTSGVSFAGELTRRDTA